MSQQPSRELDARIAERLFGWEHHVAKLPAGDLHCWRLPEVPGQPGRVLKLLEDLPAFSTDIACAWRVVERMRELGYDFELHRHRMLSGARFSKPRLEPELRSSKTDPHAICLAALEALGQGGSR